MFSRSVIVTVFFCLSLPAGAAANAAPATTDVSSPAGTELPAALRPVLYRTLARDAGPAYAVDRNDCVSVPRQHLSACFGRRGARFIGTDTPALALGLAAWGRGTALHSIPAAAPAIAGNRVSYAHGALTEWWRVLPMGFEQGFTIARRPAGQGELRLALASGGNPIVKGGTVQIGALRYGHLLVTDAIGKIVPSHLLAKDGRILIAVNDARARYPLSVDPLVWVQQQKLTASDGAAYDLFGFSVALDGTTALVGAPISTFGGDNPGAAYVFDDSDGTWTQTAKLTASDGAPYDAFGISVALAGTTALIGANAATIGGNGAQGAAYVFYDSGGTWIQTQKLTASDGAANDHFGSSLALDDTTALIGANAATIGGHSAQGAAYVFDGSGGTWTQTAKLTASDGAPGDYLGVSVALDGTTALVEAWGADIGGNANQGAAYVFDEAGGTWTQTQKLTASDGAANDHFGSSLALDGTTAIAGVPAATIGGIPYQGAAYLFHDSGGTWTQTQKLTESEGAGDDFFGNSVALAGTTALVGSPGTIVGENYPGAAYVFDEAGGTWTQTAELIASDGATGDSFGSSVALDGITVLAGAPYATVAGNTQQGAAYVYTATCPQGYGEHDGSLNAGKLYGSPPYQAPAGIENGILGGPAGFKLYAQYSNGASSHVYRIPGNEIHKLGPAGTYRWGAKAGNTGGDYVLCVLHP